ncbi:U4/U6-U5 snRNP complex subunit prp31 [Podospora pseudopauciseta]|uniref:U4/U6-U5 snRNP complex subunit prp31 n=2 Tax=Podospora TaxID=5144 RepID=A0ABR0I043_9PEZI|nr:U4/U6-U5 snRNP complex subunit prp31 [Podospora pseudopauciseta]KAK4682089.1 U4/U6-U5 snRNP complex subunit prp31 [Podospora pseudoanserina]
MSSYADELLDDFGDDFGEEQGNDDDFFTDEGLANGAQVDTDMVEARNEGDGNEDADMIDEEAAAAAEDEAEAKGKIEKMNLGAVRDVRTVAGLMKTLKPVLEKIAHYEKQPAQSVDSVGNVEDHPEYHLLTQSNSLSTQIDNEIALVHKFIRDHYSVRFPELETLITNPLEYAKVVACLGNGPMDSDSIKGLLESTNNILGVSLKKVLDGPSLMIVTVEATTSKGQAMPEEELQRVVQACEMVISLDEAKKTLTQYVQSRMNIFAPNLTALIGSLTAAQLLNQAGGLTGLSKAPACNLPAWGSKKQNSSALATNVGIRQQGFIFQAPIIREVPSDLKKQAMKMFANKIVMCARTDCFHQFRDGSEGERLRDECLDRLDKLQAKPNAKGARALPAPDDKPSRKRGGRRARKAKEATAMTELRKAQNRVAFGKEEKEVGYGVGDSTKGLGMIGQRDDGRLRVAQIDQRTRAKLSAKSKGWGGTTSIGGASSSLRSLTGGGAGNISLASKGLRTSGVGTSLGGGATAGTVSSLAFTPMQGLELVDPKAMAESRKRKAEEEDRWFKGGTFTQIGGGSGGGGGGSGVFKKPALPPAKRVDTGSTKP